MKLFGFLVQAGCVAALKLPRNSSLSNYCAASQKKALKFYLSLCTSAGVLLWYLCQ